MENKNQIKNKENNLNDKEKKSTSPKTPKTQKLPIEILKRLFDTCGGEGY